MLRSVWKAEQLPDGLAAQIHARTGGNALFNEEVARGLRDDGTVRVDDGRAVLSGDLTQLHLPDSVHAVIRARIDRFDPDAREVLRLASVIGREFTLPLLDRLYPSPAKLHHALDTLTHQDLIHPLRVVPEPAYLFKHALVQDVVYETLLLSQRKKLHEQAGAAIEWLYADRLEEQYEALAHHYSQSEDTEKAVEYLEKAGDKAAAMFLIARTIRRYREALAILDRFTLDSHLKRRRIDLSIKWAMFGSFLPFAADVDLMRRSVDYAEELSDQFRLAYSTFWLGRVNYYLSNGLEARALFQRCAEWAEAMKDDVLLALVKNSFGRVLMFNNEISESLRHIELAIPLADAQGQQFERILSRFYSGMGYSWKGNLRAGRKRCDEALELARAVANRFLEAWCEYCRSYPEWMSGAWSAALDHLERSQDIATEIEAEAPVAQSLAIQGYCQFMAGNLGQGLTLLRQGVELIEKTEHKFLLPLTLPLCADAHAIAGDLRNAEKYAEWEKQVVKPGWRFGEFLLERALALIAAQQGTPDWNKAIAQITRAQSYAKEIDTIIQASYNHFRYAEILHKKGDLAAALQQLSQAEKLFAEMEMTWWSGQAAALRARIEGGKPFVWFAPYVDGPPKV
jgi:tetratricopeptide (TPR) repeat protein